MTDSKNRTPSWLQKSGYPKRGSIRSRSSLLRPITRSNFRPGLRICRYACLRRRSACIKTPTRPRSDVFTDPAKPRRVSGEPGLNIFNHFVVQRHAARLFGFGLTNPQWIAGPQVLHLTNRDRQQLIGSKRGIDAHGEQAAIARLAGQLVFDDLDDAAISNGLDTNGHTFFRVVRIVALR